MSTSTILKVYHYCDVTLLNVNCTDQCKYIAMSLVRVEKMMKKKPLGRPKKKMKAVGRLKELCYRSDKQMSHTMENGELGVNCAAIQYGVPKTTLKDRISGRVQHCTKPERVAYLTHAEEELLNFLFEFSWMVYGKTNAKFYKLSKMLAAKKKGSTLGCPISDGWTWWHRFHNDGPRYHFAKGIPFLKLEWRWP